jgi:hypothetical protein
MHLALGQGEYALGESSDHVHGVRDNAIAAKTGKPNFIRFHAMQLKLAREKQRQKDLSLTGRCKRANTLPNLFS